ncbi:Transcription factor Spt20 [Artemisia annua]|uniref:Transcription factor Spt20 n=1 Tax=Artemisia annua TaxID=35608 RepID=A0A2U1PXR5_ARTAN|nr:Transcription factor Spt20 [Artemisia annua]
MVMKKVSFKVPKIGTRYPPKPKPNPLSVFVDNEVDAPTVNYPQFPRVQNDNDFTRKRSSNAAYQIASKYDPKLLHPYDWASQSLFAAIECCRVPANFFDDIPCKYKNGKVACEVRDWRKDSSEPGVSVSGPSIAATPSIRRISLKMSVDSIVRDIPEIIKRDWAYGELLEAEAKILLALYPKIDLHPYPNFDRLCEKLTTVKLNLDFRAMRRKRLRQMSVPEKSNLGTDDSKPMMDQPSVADLATQNVGQRLGDQPNVVNLATQNVGQCNSTVPSPINHAPDTSIPTFQSVSHQPKDQFGVETRGHMQSHAPGTAFNAPRASFAMVNLSSGNDGINSFMSAFEGGRGIQDGQSSSMVNSDYRNRSNPLSFVDNQQQNIASHNALGASAFDCKWGNQDRQSFSMANSHNRNWSDPLALIGNHQQMTLEILDNTPGTAFNALRASSTRSMSLPSANHGIRSRVFAFDSRIRSNSLVYLGNQQQQLANNGGISSIIPFDGNKGNQDGLSSSVANMDNRNWSNPLAEVFNQHQLIPCKSRNEDNNQSNPLAFAGYQQQQIAASHMQNQQHGMMSSGSDNDGLWSIMSAFDNKRGHQDGQSSSMANLNKRNRLNPLDFNGNQLRATDGITHGQQGIRHNIKQEPLEIGREPNRLHPSFPPPFTRSNFVKEEYFHSRTSASSTKQGELSSGPMGMQFGTVGSSQREKSVVALAPAIGSTHRETSVVNSVPAVGDSRSSSSGTNSSMHPTQMAATLGSKPLPTIHILSGIGSSSSVGNTSGPFVASGAVQKPPLTIPILSGTGPSSNIGNMSGPSVARRDAPRSGPRGVSPLSICNPSPGPSSVTTIEAVSIMDVKPSIAQRRHLVLGLTACRQSSNAGGSQSDNLQVPSGSGSGVRGQGSRGRGSRDRAPRGRAPFGQKNDMGPPPRMALSNPSVSGLPSVSSGASLPSMSANNQ